METTAAPVAAASTTAPIARERDAGRVWASRFAWGVALLAAYTALAAFFTWPLAAHLNDAVTSAVDPVDNIWRIVRGQQQLLRDPARLFDGGVFYPYANTYLFDGLILGVVLVALPLAIVGVPPVAMYNCAVLLAFALCGVCMYPLARHLGAGRGASFLAGAIYAFAPLHMARVGHVGIASIMWFPLVVLLLDRLTTRPTKRDVLALAACLALQAFASQYYALYLLVLVPLYLVIAAVRKPEARRWPVLLHLAAAGVLALAIVLPVAVPFAAVAREYGIERTYGQITYYAASLTSFVTADGTNRLWGTLTAPLRASGTYTWERNMFPGLLALVFAGVGAWAGRRRTLVQFLIALAVVGAAFAIGPEIRLSPGSDGLHPRFLPYDVLYWHLPGWDSMRVPARFGALYLLGVAGLAAVGIEASLRTLSQFAPLASRRPRLASVAPALALAVLAVGLTGEYANHPVPLTPIENETQVPPVYRWLAAQPPGAVLELPLVVPDHDREQRIATRQQYFALYHDHPIVNGNANVVPKGYKALALEMPAFPSPRTVSLVQGLGISYVTVGLSDSTERDRAAMRTRLRTLPPDVTLAAQFGETSVYRVAPHPKFAQLRAAIPPTATVMLSRADPLQLGSYAAMIGYVLRDNPLYANLRVEFGTDYRGPADPLTTRYDAAVLFADEDPAVAGFAGVPIVWEDGIVKVYRRG